MSGSGGKVVRKYWIFVTLNGAEGTVKKVVVGISILVFKVTEMSMFYLILFAFNLTSPYNWGDAGC